MKLGLTQEELASKAGVTKNYVTMVESGARKNVDVLVRIALAEALGILPPEIITENEQRKLKFIESAVTLEAAEVFVWHLARCIRDGEQPLGSKYGAQIALRRVAAARPERRKELQQIRTRLNQLYWK